jgi:glycosyltransferase involved in cell wall biosynthesis
MKIALISSSQIPSTTANSIQVMKVCQALARLGHEIKLWAPDHGGSGWEGLESHYGLERQFDIVWLPGSRVLKRYDLAFSAVNQAAAWGAGLVYTWLPQAGMLSLLRRIPVMLEMHDMPTGRMGPTLFRQFVRMRGRKRLLVITQALYDKLRKEYQFDLPPQEVRIAPNGVDLHHYAGLPDAAEARRQLGLKDGLTVGYTGHFYSGRGMDLLLELIPLFPQVNFLIVGGQPEKVAVWQAAMQQSQYANVHTTGFIDNARLPLYQAAADILLMPYERVIAGSSGGNSAEICSPMKMFDYLAAGRAILTSDLPVFHEVLNEENAVFCPPNDTEAWKAALERLIADAPARRRLAEQAKRDSTHYAWDARARRALENF